MMMIHWEIVGVADDDDDPLGDSRRLMMMIHWETVEVADDDDPLGDSRSR